MDRLQGAVFFEPAAGDVLKPIFLTFFGVIFVRRPAFQVVFISRLNKRI